MTIMSIRGVSLFVKVIGHGYPIVLMHGGPSLDHTTLLSLQPLADQFTLIFYDHRCNGRSEGAEVASMTWENLTADAGLRLLYRKNGLHITPSHGFLCTAHTDEDVTRLIEIYKAAMAGLRAQGVW